MNQQTRIMKIVKNCRAMANESEKIASLLTGDGSLLKPGTSFEVLKTINVQLVIDEIAIMNRAGRSYNSLLKCVDRARVIAVPVNDYV